MFLCKTCRNFSVELYKYGSRPGEFYFQRRGKVGGVPVYASAAFTLQEARFLLNFLNGNLGSGKKLLSRRGKTMNAVYVNWGNKKKGDVRVAFHAYKPFDREIEMTHREAGVVRNMLANFFAGDK